MTINDFISMEIDIDVYDDVCEELSIAFVGPCKLTDEGKKEFADIMDYEVDININSYGGLPVAIVKIDDPDDVVCSDRLSKAKHFFESAAGYCSFDDYDKWFVVD